MEIPPPSLVYLCIWTSYTFVWLERVSESLKYFLSTWELSVYLLIDHAKFTKEAVSLLISLYVPRQSTYRTAKSKLAKAQVSCYAKFLILSVLSPKASLYIHLQLNKSILSSVHTNGLLFLVAHMDGHTVLLTTEYYVRISKYTTWDQMHMGHKYIDSILGVPTSGRWHGSSRP